jgi:drug/metabolite transporter (DMT)-like permease
VVLRELAAPGTLMTDGGSAGAVFLAGFANVVALGGLAMALRLSPVATVNTISSGNVVLSFVASVLIFGESGSAPMIAGMVLVTAGILVAQLRRGAGPGTTPPAAVADATPT